MTETRLAKAYHAARLADRLTAAAVVEARAARELAAKLAFALGAADKVRLEEMLAIARGARVVDGGAT